jgi:hypothetical protein
MTRYLQVSFRNGKPLAAYFFLRGLSEKSVRSAQRDPGIVIDYGPDGKPLGIEITAPSVTTLADLNRVLAELSESPATEQELRPLRAA